MFDADGAFALDCWIIVHEEQDGKRSGVIQTISKSISDEFLNSSSTNISPILNENSDVNAIKHLKTIHCKIKNQEIKMQYPVIASNIGTRRINIQSIA